MVTIADVLALPAFKDVRIVAPCEGAGRRSVRNVGILDCPPDLNGYSNYFPGELILTNLGFASGNERLSERSLITLIDRHVAGVAIKTVYDPIITDAVREESSREGVPVFVYDGAYHEEVAYQALDLIRRDSEVLDKSQQIRGFLHPRSDEETCSQVLSVPASGLLSRSRAGETRSRSWRPSRPSNVPSTGSWRRSPKSRAPTW